MYHIYASQPRFRTDLYDIPQQYLEHSSTTAFIQHCYSDFYTTRRELHVNKTRYELTREKKDTQAGNIKQSFFTDTNSTT